MGKESAFHQLFPHIFIGRNILHCQHAHCFIIGINLWNKALCQHTLQFENFRFNLITIYIQRSSGRAQKFICLLYDDGFSTIRIPYTENIIDVSITDFLCLQNFILLKVLQLGGDIAFYFLHIQQHVMLIVIHIHFHLIFFYASFSTCSFFVLISLNFGNPMMIKTIPKTIISMEYQL